MGSFFKQYAWLFDLIVIVLCSFFLAKIVSVYLGKSFEVERSVALLKPPEAVPEAPAVEPSASYQIIIDRDIFDSSETIAETKEGEETSAAGETVPTGEAVKTSLPIKVWAVLVVGEGRDKRSSATIESSSSSAPAGGKGGGGKTDVFAVNDDPSFAPNTKLVRVAPDRIEFIHNGRLEYAELVNDMTASIFGPPTETGPTVAAKEPAPAGPLVKEAGGKFTIDQSEVDKALSNLDQLYTEIRAVPNFQGGKMSGMKVLSVKSGSIFEKLGLRRGDVLQRVNGTELDVRKGFEIFNQLKDAKTFTLDLVRQGQPKTLDYEVR